jgi:hypothetical protein
MSTETLARFLASARNDPELRAELDAAAGPQGLPLSTLVTMAAHHGHHIDPALVVLPGPRLTESSPADAGGLSLGASRVYEGEDGTLMVRV